METSFRISRTGTAALAVLLSSAAWATAHAQDITLPQVTVTDTRLLGIGRGGGGAGTGGGTTPAQTATSDQIGTANVPDGGGGMTA